MFDTDEKSCIFQAQKLAAVDYKWFLTVASIASTKLVFIINLAGPLSAYIPSQVHK